MTLKLYNTLTRKKEVFKPTDEKRVTMYNCGPTVYSYAHIGNARAAVAADVLFRVLRHIYGADHVVYARNITDVDDRINALAAKQGVEISVITEKFAKIYNDDLTAIGCLQPTMQPRATAHMDEMIAMISKLMDDGYAYGSEGHVFFDISKYDDYGKLSGNTLEQLRKGERVEDEEYARKKNAADFVLWKPSKKDEPVWKARFGNGRPGWHIECSAMIEKNLGTTIDIHCGGVDLKFPHHENEIAQSNCAHDAPLANYWMHNEFLNMGKNKMSKSLGNVVLVHDLLKEWDGEVIRLALLKAHYRSELIWSEHLLKESKENLDHAYRYKLTAMELTKLHTGTLYGFDISLFSDLGTPEAFKDIVFFSGSVSQVVQCIIKGEDIDWNDAKVLDEYINSWNLLGLLQKDPEEWFRGKGKEGDLTDSEIEALIVERGEARRAKDWTRGDEIRDLFKAENIVLEDGKDGTTWRRG